MRDYNTVSEVLEQYVNNIPGKVSMPFGKLFGKSMFAGALIAFGAEASSVAAHAVTNVGLARLIAGAVFPVGLMAVILLGAELFTGDCMLALGIPAKKISYKDLVRMLITIFFGDFVGAVIVAALTFLSGQFNYSAGLLGAYTIKVAAAKTGISFTQGITSGILCNVLVCGAVLMAMCSNDVMGKLFVSFFVILAFVVSGFEHCVANMYYISAGLLCKLNPTYVQVAQESLGVTQTQLDGLNLTGFLIQNLVPVTIGNIVGGAILFGLPLYFLNIAKKEK